MRLGLGFSSPPPSPKARDPFGKLRAGSGTLGVVENDLGNRAHPPNLSSHPASDRHRCVPRAFDRIACLQSPFNPHTSTTVAA